MWTIEYLREAIEDMKRLDQSQRIQVVKAINKVSINPLPQAEGGYGKSLGNRVGTDLAGYCKIKLLKLGIRIVYKIVKENNTMKIIVVSARADDEVYILANKRKATQYYWKDVLSGLFICEEKNAGIPWIKGKVHKKATI